MMLVVAYEVLGMFIIQLSYVDNKLLNQMFF